MGKGGGGGPAAGAVGGNANNPVLPPPPQGNAEGDDGFVGGEPVKRDRGRGDGGRADAEGESREVVEGRAEEGTAEDGVRRGGRDLVDDGAGLVVERPRKRERRTSKAASRRRSTLNPWELQSLIQGDVAAVAAAEGS